MRVGRSEHPLLVRVQYEIYIKGEKCPRRAWDVVEAPNESVIKQILQEKYKN